MHMILERVRHTGIMITMVILVMCIAGCSNGTDRGQKEEKGAVMAAAGGMQPFDPGKNADAPGIGGTEGMKIIAENQGYALYLDPKTTDFAVLVKSSGDIIHSNPAKADETLKVNEETAAATGSPLTVEFYDLSGNRGEFTTGKECIPYGQFSFYSIENGVRIVYTIGKDEGKRVIPPVLTPETYAAIYEKVGSTAKRDIENAYGLLEHGRLTDEEKDLYLKNYPALQEKDLYIVRNLNNRQKKFVEEAMAEAEFTLEQMQAEMMAAGFEAADRQVVFTIPLDISIDAKGFIAAVDSSLIQGPENYKIHKLGLLPGFGGTQQKEGYMLVPDGSGAIIALDAGEGNDVYAQRIYGNDETFSQRVIEVKGSQAVMPVFGMKSGEMAVFSIIEEGEALAGVVAKPISTVNPIARIHAEFIITEKDYRDYTGLMRQPQGIILPREACTGIMRVRYGFLHGEETNYSTMAGFYRQYLIEEGVLQKQSEGKVPFYLEIPGAVDKKESFAGLPINMKEALTTYTQAAEIVKALYEKGVKGIHLRYIGWANGGWNYTVMDQVQLVSALGGESDFRKLKEYLNQNQSKLFPEADFNYVYKDGWMDNFHYKKDASRRLDIRTATLSDYNSATLRTTGRNFKYIVSSSRMPLYAKSFIQSISRYLPVGGVSLGSIGAQINSDYKSDETIERNEAQFDYESTMKLFHDQGYEIMVDRGNAYTWKYAKHVLNLPTGSSELLMEMESIPFCQMVLHGYVNYASNPFNISSDIQYEVLKAIETGSAVYYRMMYAPNTALQDTSHEDLYSLHYTNWIDIAAQAYTDVTGTLEKLAAYEIVQHEKLEEGVYATTYSDGSQWVVNYNRRDVSVAGKEVKALGYALMEVGQK